MAVKAPSAVHIGGVSITRANRGALIAGTALLMAYYAYAALSPNPILRGGDTVVRWDIYDKRPIVNAYLVTIAWFVLLRFVCGAPARENDVLPSRAARRLPWQRVAWFALGALLGVLLYAEGISAGVLRPDTHLDVQLGGIQAMALGRTPYVDAHTQYGPGTQLLLHALMNTIEFSYWGALQAQALVNVVTVSAFCGLLVWFLPPPLGLASVALLGAFVSPLFATEYPGWGWLTRWFGTAATAMILADVIFRPEQRAAQWAFALVGVAWGGFCFLSQEALGTGVVAMGLVFALAAGFGALSRRDAIVSALVVVTSGGVTLVGLVATFIGLAHLPEVVHLYTMSSGRVAAGVSNTTWISPGTPSAIVDTLVYHASFVLFPAMVALVSVYGRPVADGAERRRTGQVVGVLAGATALSVLTLFRADPPHLQGPSFLLGALLVCGATILPRTLDVPSWTAKIIRYGFAGALVLAVALEVTVGQPAPYRMPGAVVANLAADVAATRHASAARARHEESEGHRVISERIGGPVGWQSRYPASIVDLATRLRHQIGTRRVVIDDTNVPTSELFFHPGLLFFLGDLRPASAITDPTISIWLASDYLRWQQDLESNDPECLVTFAPDLKVDPMVRWFMTRYHSDAGMPDTYRTDRASYSVICRAAVS